MDAKLTNFPFLTPFFLRVRMMRFLCDLALTLVAFTLLLPQLYAGSPVTMCFDANSKLHFSTKEVIALGLDIQNKMPQVNYDLKGKANGLSWEPVPKNTLVEVQKIGQNRARGIYRVIYRKNDYPVDARKSQLVYAMFGYQDVAPNGGLGIRPFFISADESVSQVESYFSSSSDQPFALEIEESIKGNGAGWQSFTFVFSPIEARIVETREGGRGGDTTWSRFDKSGKIVATGTYKEN